MRALCLHSAPVCAPLCGSCAPCSRGFARHADRKYDRQSASSAVHVTNHPVAVAGAQLAAGLNHFYSFEALGRTLTREHGFP
eukprot:3627493-Prymnesium_polylepis.1